MLQSYVSAVLLLSAVAALAIAPYRRQTALCPISAPETPRFRDLVLASEGGVTA